MRDLLEERDPFRWAVWVALHEVAVAERNEQQEQANRSGGARVAGHKRRR